MYYTPDPDLAITTDSTATHPPTIDEGHLLQDTPPPALAMRELCPQGTPPFIVGALLARGVPLLGAGAPLAEGVPLLRVEAPLAEGAQLLHREVPLAVGAPLLHAGAPHAGEAPLLRAGASLTGEAPLLGAGASLPSGAPLPDGGAPLANEAILLHSEINILSIALLPAATLQLEAPQLDAPHLESTDRSLPRLHSSSTLAQAQPAQIQEHPLLEDIRQQHPSSDQDHNPPEEHPTRAITYTMLLATACDPIKAQDLKTAADTTQMYSTPSEI